MCHCKSNIGGIKLFVGCKWHLVESNCPSVLFSLARESADFDDSFNDQTLTGESFEDTIQKDTSMTETRVVTHLKEEL